MRAWDFSILFLLISYLLIAGGHVVIGEEGDEVENEHPFTYDWQSDRGPKNWGNLRPEWRTCGSGKYQSPIDLADDKVIVMPALGHLQRTYKPTLATIESRGHDIKVEWLGDAGGVVINGTEYKLEQCHWHLPAEHTKNGDRYKMETHMVHHSCDGQVAVIGILHKLGRPDPFLSKLLDHIKNVTEDPKHVGIINPWDIKFGSRKYYRYIGSLTVPPCTEGVIWTILKKVRTVSIEQIRALREAVHDGFEDNARPIQQSNGRSTFLFCPLK